MFCRGRRQQAPVANAAGLLACTITFAMLWQSAASTNLRLAQVHVKPGSVEAGELVHIVKDRLSQEHSALGEASATLLSVQTAVDHTEQSMLGKVLDVETARTLFQRHEEIETTNSKMEGEISTVNANVEGLSSTLRKVERSLLEKIQVHRASQDGLHFQIVENEAEIQSIGAELAKEQEVQRELERLAQIHRHLLAEAADVEKDGQKSEADLEKMRVASRSEFDSHRTLQAQLGRLHNYSVSCHDSVEKASKKLGIAMVAESKGSQVTALTRSQKLKADEASEQRLLAERALLVAEVKKLETKGVQDIARVRDLREDLHTLEANILSEVRSTEAKINATKEQVKTLTAALMENSQVEIEDDARRTTMEARMSELRKQLRENESPVAIITTEAQNNALQIELNEAHELWRSVKTNETAALLNLAQAASQVAAEKQSLKSMTRVLTIAEEEGQRKVAAAVKKAAAGKRKSQALFQKARSAIAKRCKFAWDTIWKSKRSMLLKCKIVKEALTVEKAKKEVLMQTLKAQSELP